MNANTELLLKDEVYRIIGAAIEVLNGLGHGFHEKPYENALVVEFGLKNIPFTQQPRYDLVYKQVKVGEYVPDLIAFSSVVVVNLQSLHCTGCVKAPFPAESHTAKRTHFFPALLNGMRKRFVPKGG